jgi:hypothetical protein
VSADAGGNAIPDYPIAEDIYDRLDLLAAIDTAVCDIDNNYSAYAPNVEKKRAAFKKAVKGARKVLTDLQKRYDELLDAEPKVPALARGAFVVPVKRGNVIELQIVGRKK